MEILYIHPSWHPLEIGGTIVDGIGAYSSLIIPELLKRGHKLHLIVTNDSSIGNLEDNKNLKLYKLPLNAGTTDNYTNGLPVKEYFDIINKILKENIIDVIYNNFQNNKIFKYLNIVANKIPVVHYSHENPITYNLNILRKYNKIGILHCGQKNLESWVCKDDPKPKVIGRNDLCSSMEFETNGCDYDRPFDFTKVVVVSRISLTKGIIEFLQVALANPNIEFTLFGSKCGIPEPGKKLKFNNQVFTGDYFEDIISKIIDTLPNVTWINKDNDDRKFLINYLKEFNGLMLSLSPVEAGATIGIEAKAFGIPVITMDFNNSNMKYHVKCPIQNSLTWSSGNEYDKFVIYDNGIILKDDKFTTSSIDSFNKLFKFLIENNVEFSRHTIFESFPEIQRHVDVLEDSLNKMIKSLREPSE